MRRFLRLVPALCGALLALGPTSVANAAPGTPAAGEVYVFSTPNNGVRGAITLTGAIGDYGTAITMTGAGVANASGNFVEMQLHKGTFKINKTKLDQISNRTNPAFNQATCSANLKVTGPVTAFDGKGLYTGISGSVEITVSFGFVLPRFTSGAHKGQCNVSNSAQPLSQWGSITGVGHVQFS